MQKVKLSTVKITIDGMTVSGSGFFCDETGLVLTCFHVIKPAITTVGGTLSLKKIFVTTTSGAIYEYGIINGIIQDSTLAKNASLMDFAVLAPVLKHTNKMPFLTLSSMDNLPEGSDLYSCGYPFGRTQFVSKGILSTKYIDTSYLIINSKVVARGTRLVALLNLTLNPGNSGGPIVMFGDTEDNDRVVGIANFIVNPIGPMVNGLKNMFTMAAQNGSILMQGINPVEMYNLFTDVLANSSVGISGCVSIDDVARAMNWNKN